jgi:murein DD-endopeptidase MepM/ murein hydrolase activator NlpD
MHRKTSSLAEYLAVLGMLAVAAARATRALVVRGVIALTQIRSIEARLLLPGLGATSVLAFGLVAGAAAVAKTDTPAPPTAAAVDARARLAAAQRADQSSRSNGSTEEPAPSADPSTAAAPAPPAWVSPMAGVRLSSCFGMRWGRMHEGLDFAGPNETPIVAAGSGTVVAAGWLYGGYGQSILIDHGNGLFTHYGHTSKLNVAPGQHVTAGQIIAWEGSTGHSTGPHLHFEVHEGLWHQINPAAFLRDHGVGVGC